MLTGRTRSVLNSATTGEIIINKMKRPYPQPGSGDQNISSSVGDAVRSKTTHKARPGRIESCQLASWGRLPFTPDVAVAAPRSAAAWRRRYGCRTHFDHDEQQLFFADSAASLPTCSECSTFENAARLWLPSRRDHVIGSLPRLTVVVRRRDVGDDTAPRSRAGQRRGDHDGSTLREYFAHRMPRQNARTDAARSSTQ